MSDAVPVSPRSAACIEILAPVGARENLPAAVFAGADSVYLGMQRFNARKGAAGFDAAALAEAVAFCHGHGVRVHVTLNTLAHPDELADVKTMLQAICDAGADAVLVQDLGVAAMVRACAPGLAMHASTQLAVYDLAGARAAAALGFRRVVLARELTLDEIAYITQNCGIETEVFIHGALCMSVSGQCYMSAFFGGRSGNRGGCAQPCRQPCAASTADGFARLYGDGLATAPAAGRGDAAAHHLSLKDLSALDRIPQLAAMGVASVKIEGRLRAPEYVAAAVHAAAAARAGLPFDGQTLEKLFSRGGFTDAHLTGRRDGRMFGMRTDADFAASREAAPAVRALYRRPLARLPVTMALRLDADSAALTVCDGAHTVRRTADHLPLPAAPDGPDAETWAAFARRCLGKTGGTPFSVEDTNITITGADTLRLSGGELNALRRAALEALYARRAAVRPIPFDAAAFALPAGAAPAADPNAPKSFIGRFASVRQLPFEMLDRLEAVILPLAERAAVPAALRDKTVLEVPRGVFGDPAPLQRLLQTARDTGFTRFEANNIGHLQLLKGCEIWAGWPLNLLNPAATALLAAWGVQDVTLSCETRLDQLPAFAGARVRTALLGYGHLPLMLTRACPLHNVTDCAACSRRGQLTDRKGEVLPVACRGAVREIFNPVPLWLGDRQQEAACDRFVLYFTAEDAARAAQVIRLFADGARFDGRFTRGLYYAPHADA